MKQIGGGTPVVSYSCIQDNVPDDTYIYPGTGNIDDDPLFVDVDGLDNISGTEDDNLRLKLNSPCLDAGTNITTPPLPPTDLDGEMRIQNGVVDMGAYEGPTQMFVIAGNPVTVHKEGTGQFYVSLTFDPNGPVEVTNAYYSGDNNISVLDGSTLYFDSNNYDIPQPVTLAAEDGNYSSGTTIIRVSAIGVAPADITATMVIYAAMEVSPPDAGSTTPPIGICEVIPGVEQSLNAQQNAGYYFVSWTAVPSENVVFANPDSPTTAATFSDDVTVTANFAPLINLTMTVSPSQAGTTSPAGVCGINPNIAIPIQA
jgi:hypothetical protein